MKNTAIIITSVILTLTVSCNKKTATTSTPTNNKSNTSQRQGGQQGDRPNEGDIFTQMDVNNDGRLAKSEVKGPLANDFEKIDTNNNGFISKAEFNAAPKPQRGSNGGGGGQRR